MLLTNRILRTINRVVKGIRESGNECDNVLLSFELASLCVTPQSVSIFLLELQSISSTIPSTIVTQILAIPNYTQTT